MQQKPNKSIFNRLVRCQEFKIISIRREIRNQHVEMHQIPLMEEESATSSAKPVSLLSIIHGSSLLRKQVIGEPAFWPFSGHSPDLRVRGQGLTRDLKLGCQRLRLMTSNTLVLDQSSSSIRDQTRREGRIAPPPLYRKGWRKGECRRGLNGQN